MDAVVAAYYGTISGPAAAPRDWDRFRSLFMPGARFVTTRRGRQGTRPVTMTPDEFIALNGRYFEQTGYDERQIACRVDTYGTIAHALSTYEARRNAGDAAPYARGLNSIQLVHDGQRWWIASVMWEYERPGGDPLPERYLPGASPDPG
ncbi:MAG: nuclear transport factor 2 family protein [Planctomycetota bacterium]